MDDMIKMARERLKSHIQSHINIQATWAIVIELSADSIIVAENGNVDLLHEISLTAKEKSIVGLLLKPAVNSTVLIGRLDDSEEYYLIQTSELSECVIKIGNSVIKVNNDVEITANSKVQIRNSSTTITELFADFIEILTSFQVVCSAPNSPSTTVFPATLTKITALNTKYKTLLK